MKTKQWGTRIFCITLLVLLSASISPAQKTRNFQGSIRDEFGASIVGAVVTLIDANNIQRTAVTNANGNYSFTDVPPGKYKVHASAIGFALSTDEEIVINAAQTDPFVITLRVAAIESAVQINTDPPVSTNSSSNADQAIVAGRDLDALPDDPAELAAALQALAASSGPDGGEIFVDGFSNGPVPRKESIREIRINQNPFATENDRAGGRIEILTKPGSDHWHGAATFNFNDESLNSRNPFQISSTKRAPFQLRQYGGNINGPLKGKKASIFAELNRDEVDDNELIRATTLDSSFNELEVAEVVQVPRYDTSLSVRLDYALDPTNTLVARFNFERYRARNLGANGFSLPDQSFDYFYNSPTFQITETSVLNAATINETRLSYSTNETRILPALSSPTVNVTDSFVGGGSTIGRNTTTVTRWELQNNTQIQQATHTIKFGARVRTVSINDVASANFNGRWTFTGGATGLTSLQRYQTTLLLQRAGMSPAQIRAAGGGAAQFSIATGKPEANVKQFDVEPFVQDDWNVRPNLNLSYGLRYEIQNNAGSRMGFAPRLALAWSPGTPSTNHPSKTVVRVGMGIFYRRFNELSTLNVNHLNGSNIQQFVFSESSDPSVSTDSATLSVLNSFGCVNDLVTPNCVTNLPSLVGATPNSQTVWRVEHNLRVPAISLIAGQVDRQLPRNFILSISANARRITHAILIRDINAPVPGTITAAHPQGIRPDPTIGEINQYEGAGRFRTAQLSVALSSRVNARFSFNANYTLSKAVSDTDGQNGNGSSAFPMNSYDLSSEWGPPLFDVRHRFTFFGTYTNPKLWGLSFAPFVVATSGPPFNITTGIDSNLDRQFTDRPSFAVVNANCASPNIRCTRYGNFNVVPGPGERIVPRNFGRGPGGLVFNLRISRSFSFGVVHQASEIGNQKVGTEKRYSLNLSLAFENLLNNVNLSPPIGNLSSPLFGQSQSLAGLSSSSGGSVNAANRRVFVNLRLRF